MCVYAYTVSDMRKNVYGFALFFIDTCMGDGSRERDLLSVEVSGIKTRRPPRPLLFEGRVKSDALCVWWVAPFKFLIFSGRVTGGCDVDVDGTGAEQTVR